MHCPGRTWFWSMAAEQETTFSDPGAEDQGVRPLSELVSGNLNAESNPNNLRSDAVSAGNFRSPLLQKLNLHSSSHLVRSMGMGDKSGSRKKRSQSRSSERRSRRCRSSSRRSSHRRHRGGRRCMHL